MPDITMCKGEECPFKEDCYLYRAKPSEYRQAYFMETPYKDGKCEYFIKFWDRKEEKKNEITNI